MYLVFEINERDWNFHFVPICCCVAIAAPVFVGGGGGGGGDTNSCAGPAIHSRCERKQEGGLDFFRSVPAPTPSSPEWAESSKLFRVFPSLEQKENEEAVAKVFLKKAALPYTAAQLYTSHKH
jgi:hypothetical protein